ncbi:protein O-mannosyl-transferase TMTC2-like isoform X1 [Myxocyprinus asiaticus]|uniref:protein O-mannosyl-transferase TMTC2-like isoform X1 n=1 Tax=Myxocyprinus asiaticus TaxID=70543 RepID=UPI00222199A7|nr:protein O-mannosyl-transferase TMTC2-like isoform X1 [Myxocyprinus asiaticus]
MILLAARFYWMGNKPPNFSNSDNPAADSPHFLTRALTFLYLPAVNAWLLLSPDRLSFDWSMDALPLLRTITDWRNLQSVTFYSGFALLAWFGLRSKGPSTISETNGKSCMSNGKSQTNGNCHSHYDNMSLQYRNHYIDSKSLYSPSRKNGYHKPNSFKTQRSLPATENLVVFSLGLLALPFIPATNLFFYVGFVVAERVLYIPSMGFCLLLTVGLRTMFFRSKSRHSRVVLLSCAVGLMILYSLKTVRRNQDWQNEEMLYRSGIAVNPAKAWGNLGNVLKNQEKMAEAEKAYRNALYYRGNIADMLYNLGLLLQESERFSEALHYYKQAIGSRPTLASAYLNMGIILVSQGNIEEAKHTFHTCVDIPDENLKDPHAHKSSVTSCLYNLGKLLHEQGQHEEALSMYKEAVQKTPRQFAPQSLYNMMGEAYMRLNNLEEASYWYRESLKAKPDHIPAHLTYGKLLSITMTSSDPGKRTCFQPDCKMPDRQLLCTSCQLSNDLCIRLP